MKCLKTSTKPVLKEIRYYFNMKKILLILVLGLVLVSNAFAKDINQSKINKKNFEMNNKEKEITSITTVDIEVNFEKLFELINLKI